ncbi:MAG TPA: GDP-mannose 4,6-dehydratase, partial [Henriciella marina]|nr:GDP-mannose 4,6-dehydratase [Henriciella marina]
GDPAKAKKQLGWSHETSPRDLAREMVQSDLKVMQRDPVWKDA